MTDTHDDKGYSEERCIRCGWVMGHPPLNCNNDNTPHVFPSQIQAGTVPDLRERLVGALMAATPDNVGESRVQRVVDDVWPVIEELLLSNRSVNGVRLTWQEHAEAMVVERNRYSALVQILQDLDRCEHGRHEGDPCTLTGGCGGPSKGNPVVRAACGRPPLAQYDLRQIGHGMDGRPIVIPAPGTDDRDPAAWRR